MAYKVSEVAKLANITIRTLHHYDEVGLLVPSDRSEAGYRLYTAADLEKLQQVLFYKELGFALDDIRRIMDDPRFDRTEALRTQRELVADQKRRLDTVLSLIDRTLNALEGDVTMSKEEMFDGFAGFDPARYEDEVKERWGETDAYKESSRRTRSYSKEDFKKINAENDAITRELASLMAEGIAATDARAMDAAEQARMHIDRYFYPCSHEMHTMLGRMYVSDARFTAAYDGLRPGLAQYVCNAIEANAARKS